MNVFISISAFLLFADAAHLLRETSGGASRRGSRRRRIRGTTTGSSGRSRRPRRTATGKRCRRCTGVRTSFSSPQATEDFLPQYTKLPTDREPARAPVAGHWTEGTTDDARSRHRRSDAAPYQPSGGSTSTTRSSGCGCSSPSEVMFFDGPDRDVRHPPVRGRRRVAKPGIVSTSRSPPSSTFLLMLLEPCRWSKRTPAIQAATPRDALLAAHDHSGRRRVRGHSGLRIQSIWCSTDSCRAECAKE